MIPSHPDFPRALATPAARRANLYLTTGRWLFGCAVLSLGLVHLITGNFPVALLPVPADLPGRFLLAWLVGGMLTLAGAGIVLAQKTGLAALITGFLLLALAGSLHLPLLLKNPFQGGLWTVFTELLALGGGAIFLSGFFLTASARGFHLASTGRWLFIASLIVFGIQHLMYADYIATLIPAWIPAPLGWAYFVGLAFFATALSLSIRRQSRFSATLLGLMFLLWVLLLHLPRVMVRFRTETEWTSLWIALAMGGIAFLFASAEE
ncbi:hypothetical protein GCM10027299_23880 [Larkinella ripae]